MEAEILSLIKVWIGVFACLSYCYAINKIVSRGPARLLCVLPVVFIFLFLPLNLNSVHLGGTTAFFISWLGNFKLLLFAFGKGPLCSDSSISLGRFVAVACTPIKIHQKKHPSPPISHLNGKNKEIPKGRQIFFPLRYVVIGVLLAILIRIYDYSEHIHPKVILFLYCFHIYFLLEIILAMVAALARALLGVELEPQFNEPYPTTSLQDFWGRRWNLMVSSILRPTVYDPTRHAMTRVVGRKWVSIAAILATFVVSGLMHELMFYYLGCVNSTWEVTWFFLLQGSCLAVEVVLKKAVFASRWRLPQLVSGPLTIGFVMVTCFWLFFPQFLRCKVDERALEECAALGKFVKNVTRTLTYKFSTFFGITLSI
ncbi:acyl-CoA--sterol O-acyltransferase 1-like [Corylus avellana]|uniref:acyl-CoA--sterol O-acyltransferase 1-like n=1 Tax=Corylus avellana TaxID=13451 RepID=UPI00286BC625|nr:acyl-CoA--sterol O-acyltransferase 1-like [Corylus avellana]